MIGAYFKRIFVTIDVLLNVLRGGDVETISSARGKDLAQPQPCRFRLKLCRFIDRLFGGRWQGHCLNNRMRLTKVD
jgi:hypothetical protein